MKILGAGLAGLLAANMLRKYDPVVYESKSSLPNNHTALLRHRELKVSEATSIPFRKVTVRKAINYKGELLSESNIALSNMYSKKVIGAYLNRSITNMSPVERYIAPPDFIQKLALGCNIVYGYNFQGPDHALMNEGRYDNEVIISTIPMPSMVDMFGSGMTSMFDFREVTVVTAYIEDCDVYQTVYYPNPDLQLYRMSITGNKVIAEFVGKVNTQEFTYPQHAVRNLPEYIVHFLGNDFGIRLNMDDLSDVSISQNKYGKIKEIDDSERKQFIRMLTDKHGIYSLGRFATWRNLLLDDVHNDILVIQNMIANNGYYTGERKC